MSDRKGWGNTVLGWFVTREGETGEPIPGEAEPIPEGEVPADGAEPGAASPVGEVFASEPPAVVPGAEIDFDAVFDAAGLTAEQRERVQRAGDLLQSLPPGTDEKVQRQIVGASLAAFGVPVESIIETAVGQIEALEAYIRKGAAETKGSAEETERKISEFEDLIRRLRAGVEQRVAAQKALADACNRRKLDAQRILEFFGRETVARVVHESPKLTEPGAARGRN